MLEKLGQEAQTGLQDTVASKISAISANHQAILAGGAPKPAAPRPAAVGLPSPQELQDITRDAQQIINASEQGMLQFVLVGTEAQQMNQLDILLSRQSGVLQKFGKKSQISENTIPARIADVRANNEAILTAQTEVISGAAPAIQPTPVATRPALSPQIQQALADAKKGYELGIRALKKSYLPRKGEAISNYAKNQVGEAHVSLMQGVQDPAQPPLMIEASNEQWVRAYLQAMRANYQTLGGNLADLSEIPDEPKAVAPAAPTLPAATRVVPRFAAAVAAQRAARPKPKPMTTPKPVSKPVVSERDVREVYKEGIKEIPRSAAIQNVQDSFKLPGDRRSPKRIAWINLKDMRKKQRKIMKKLGLKPVKVKNKSNPSEVYRAVIANHRMIKRWLDSPAAIPAPKVPPAPKAPPALKDIAAAAALRRKRAAEPRMRAHVPEVEPKTFVSPATQTRKTLLEQIRERQKLKPAEKRQLAPVVKKKKLTLQQALEQQLRERRGDIELSEEEESDSDWEESETEEYY